VLALSAFCLRRDAEAQEGLPSSEPADSAAEWPRMTPMEMVSSPEPRFPKLAELGSMAGRLTLKILVGRDGLPIATNVYNREPEVAFAFDEEARRFGMNCRFKPALDSLGSPIAMGMCVPLNFEPAGFTPPSCQDIPAPNYPEWARELGIQGWVGLMVLVDEGGRVISDQTQIMSKYPAELDVFDEAAKGAAAQAIFVPGLKDGVPTKSWGFIKVEFDMPLH
jgi:TonB family protein